MVFRVGVQPQQPQGRGRASAQEPARCVRDSGSPELTTWPRSWHSLRTLRSVPGGGQRRSPPRPAHPGWAHFHSSKGPECYQVWPSWPVRAPTLRRKHRLGTTGPSVGRSPGLSLLTDSSDAAQGHAWARGRTAQPSPCHACRPGLTSSPGAKSSWHRGHRLASFSGLAAAMVSAGQDSVILWDLGGAEKWDVPCAARWMLPSQPTCSWAPQAGPRATHGHRLPFQGAWAALPLRRPRRSDDTSQTRPFCRIPSAGARSGCRSPPPGPEVQSTACSRGRGAVLPAGTTCACPRRDRQPPSREVVGTHICCLWSLPHQAPVAIYLLGQRPHVLSASSVSGTQSCHRHIEATAGMGALQSAP